MHWYDGSLITIKRKDKSWTQQHVSTQTGLSRNQIIAMEKGHFTGGIKYLRKYLDLLGLNEPSYQCILNSHHTDRS